MFGIIHDKHAELAAMLQKIVDASAVHVKNGGSPPRDSIGIPNLERLVFFLNDTQDRRYTLAMLMAVFEATLIRYEPYVSGLESAGLLTAGFTETVRSMVHHLRAKKEKKMGLNYLESQAQLFSADGRVLPPAEAAVLPPERAALANVMQKIIDAGKAFQEVKGYGNKSDDTRRLQMALQDPLVDRLFLVFCLGCFESTMMGYSDEVLGLEEHQYLPKGFAGMTIERVRRLREEVGQPVSSKLAGE